MSRVQQFCLIMLAGILVSSSGCANSRQRLAAVFGGRAGGGSDDFTVGEVTDYRDADIIKNAKNDVESAAKGEVDKSTDSVIASADDKLKSLKTRSKSMTDQFTDPADALIAKAKRRGLEAMKKSDFPDDPFNNDYDAVIAATDRSTDGMIAAAKNRTFDQIQQTRARANSALQTAVAARPATPVRKPVATYKAEVAEPLLAHTPPYRERDATERAPISLPKNYNRYEDTRDPRGYAADPRDSQYEIANERRSNRDYDYPEESARDEHYAHGADPRSYEPQQEQSYGERRNSDRYARERSNGQRQSERRYADDQYASRRGDVNAYERRSADRYEDDRRHPEERRYEDERGYRDDRRVPTRNVSSQRTAASRVPEKRPADDDDPLRPSKIFYPDAEPARKKPDAQPKKSSSRPAQNMRDPRERDYDSRRDPRDAQSEYRGRKESYGDRRRQDTRDRNDGRVTDFDQLFDDLARKRSQKRRGATPPVRRRGFDDDFEADDGRDPKQYESNDSSRFEKIGPTANDDSRSVGPANQEPPQEFAGAAETNADSVFDDMNDDELTEFAASDGANDVSAAEEKLAQDLVQEFEEATVAAQETESTTENSAADVVETADVASTESAESPFPDFGPLSTEEVKVTSAKPVAKFASQAKPVTARVVANASSSALSVDDPTNPFSSPFENSTTTASTSNENPFDPAFSGAASKAVAAHDVAPNRLPEFSVPDHRPPLPQITPGPIRHASMTGSDPVFDSGPVFAGRTPQNTLENVAMEVKPDFDVLTKSEEPPQKQWIAMLVVGICSIFLVYLLRPTNSRV